MYRPRIIPVLLLRGNVLVKSVEFKKHNYIGDPINAVKIFNDLKADELVFLDIEATKENRLISLDFVREVGEEANMPFSVGGGIKSLNDIEAIIKEGAERVILNSVAENFDFIRSATSHFGSSTISVCIDVKKKRFKSKEVWIKNGSKSLGVSPIEFAKRMEDCGVGEIIVQSISNDGKMSGYDYDLVRQVAESVTIPVVALGGAGKPQDLVQVFDESFANGLAAGSMFVYHGLNKGVLINYPAPDEIQFNRQV